ncbi:tRNA lysidine(34) synthetase TilS [Dactylosporangium sp. CS-033363]|uniref:tRNA lysidine(34) synthetase TilS n=1 Tax=Dactylosporangium sp. CS-033363 TaxID=3239935 RepID=UPI003D8C1B22
MAAQEDTPPIGSPATGHWSPDGWVPGDAARPQGERPLRAVGPGEGEATVARLAAAARDAVLGDKRSGKGSRGGERVLSAAPRRVVAGDTVLVACSGGADSLALAVAALFVSRRIGVRCGLVTVDHRLQHGSGDRAAELADWAVEKGFSPVQVRTVRVGNTGGPEAAAREARYAALEAAAVEHGAVMVLLGHTRDDQAETVLLALARGSGPRGLAGMPERRVRNGVLFVRPLLDVSRAETRAACAAEGLSVWDDPHNVDVAYARSRVRPLVAALGEGVVDNLARTARLIGADSAFLDGLAGDALEKAVTEGGGLAVAELERMPGPIRTRVLHAWALRLGVPGTDLSYRHVDALEQLIVRWHGQGAVALPGGLSVSRTGGQLRG